jgi:hypothetical protein
MVEFGRHAALRTQYRKMCRFKSCSWYHYNLIFVGQSIVFALRLKNMIRGSSAVEQVAVNHWVVGSSPSLGGL